MIKFRTNSTHLFLVIVVKKVLIVLRVRSCPILTFSYTDTMIVILLVLLLYYSTTTSTTTGNSTTTSDGVKLLHLQIH